MRARLRDVGLMEYKACWDLQQQLFDGVLAQKTRGHEPDRADKIKKADQADKINRADQAGEILLVEHPPVYTLGKSGHAENLLVAQETLKKLGAQFFHIDRGGDITFHGPGQLVVYPILDLERLGIGLRAYIEALEQAVIRTVAHYGICAGRIAGASGVWITPDEAAPQSENGTVGQKPGAALSGGVPRKICAIGVRSSRYVTMHGLALNVSTDLGWFAHMNPCGFTDRGVTSIEHESGKKPAMEEAKELVVKFLEDELNVRIYK